MKFVKWLILFVCFLGIFPGCSSNRKLLKEHNYIAVTRNSIDKLNRNANNTKARKTIIQTYSLARNYYQDKLDQLLIGNDPLKWVKVLEIMQRSNELSEDILYNSSASHLICEPKMYTAEIAEITSKATDELYEQGVHCINQHTKEKAKEAYFYFVKAQKLNSTYKDIESKIRQARNEAIYKVIIEPVTAYTQNKVLGFSTKTFYESLFYSLRQEFPYPGFIYFYSPDDATKTNIAKPDYTVQIEISDIEFNSRQNGGAIPGTPGMTNSYSHVTSQLLIKANTLLKIYAVEQNKVVLKARIPWHYAEDLNYANYTTINQIKITLSPDNQVFFDRFSLSLCDQITTVTSNYFYNTLPLNKTISIWAVP